MFNFLNKMQEKVLGKYKAKDYWIILQQKNIQKLFLKMVKNVPAYKSFLKSRRFSSARVKSYKDVIDIPQANKSLYFRKYPLQKLVWEKGLTEHGQVMTSTSGSTGIPTYFPRNEHIDDHYSFIAEYFLNNGPKGSTLLIDCFGMGVWIGGLITYQAFRMAALRGQPVTIITPGINKKEIFSAIKILAPEFDNVILAGYPPFIKDVIDEAQEQNINFKDYNVRLLFAAESFTENFREYVSEKTNLRNPHLDTMNIYGSAELGAMAFETPGAILIRELSLKYPEIYLDLFGTNKIPTLAQYSPEFINFEVQKGQILITADNVMPFMRYNIGDNGGVLTLSEINSIFKRNKVNLEEEAKKHNITLTDLPFVYVFERSDFSTTLYGLQIYPQSIKRALENKALQEILTGKFVMETIYDKNSDQYLEVNIELKPGIKKTAHWANFIQGAIVENLLETNSEFRELTSMLTVKRTKPKIVLWTYNDEKYFKSGVKQIWLKK